MVTFNQAKVRAKIHWFTLLFVGRQVYRAEKLHEGRLISDSCYGIANVEAMVTRLALQHQITLPQK